MLPATLTASTDQTWLDLYLLPFANGCSLLMHDAMVMRIAVGYPRPRPDTTIKCHTAHPEAASQLSLCQYPFGSGQGLTELVHPWQRKQARTKASNKHNVPMSATVYPCDLRV